MEGNKRETHSICMATLYTRAQERARWGRGGALVPADRLEPTISRHMDMGLTRGARGRCTWPTRGASHGYAHCHVTAGHARSTSECARA